MRHRIIRTSIIMLTPTGPTQDSEERIVPTKTAPTGTPSRDIDPAAIEATKLELQVSQTGLCSRRFASYHAACRSTGATGQALPLSISIGKDSSASGNIPVLLTIVLFMWDGALGLAGRPRALKQHSSSCTRSKAGAAPIWTMINIGRNT